MWNAYYALTDTMDGAGRKVMKPPFEVYRESDVADADGHICTAENPQIAKEIVEALTLAFRLKPVAVAATEREAKP